MKVAYFDCFSGISGDMLIGALLDAGLDFQLLEQEIARLGLPNVHLKSSKIVKQNIASTKFDVIYEDQHHHRHLRHLNEMVERTGVDPDIQAQAKQVFLRIAEAEAKIHNMSVEQVHFHEVGAVDTIVDVVGALVGFRLLGIEKVYCSRLNVGSGFVTFSHGKFPVPAPATAEILKGVPTYSTGTQGELVTPTGAAIITVLTDRFGDMPSMKTTTIGYGAGSKDFEHPNVLRVYIGELADADVAGDEVLVIETNIDDMNPQWYDDVMDQLFSAGALEVFITPVQMKKNRPGSKLTVLTKDHHREIILKILFNSTTSIGARVRREMRYILERKETTVPTKFGELRAKATYFEGERVNVKIEYDELKRIARETGMTVKQVSAGI